MCLHTAKYALGSGTGVCKVLLWAWSTWSPTHLHRTGTPGPSNPPDSMLSWEIRTAPHSGRPEPRNSLPEANGTSCLLERKATFHTGQEVSSTKCDHRAAECPLQNHEPDSQDSPSASYAQSRLRSAWCSSGHQETLQVIVSLKTFPWVS